VLYGKGKAITDHVPVRCCSNHKVCVYHSEVRHLTANYAEKYP
jgi:hypothetical protein